MTPLALVAGTLAALVHAAAGESAGEAAPEVASSTAGARAAIEQAFARELPPLPLQAFRTPAGFQGSVEGAAAPEVGAEEDAEQLSVALGTDQALACTISAKRMDVGSAIFRLAESVRKSLKLLVARPVEVAAVEGSPLVIAELGYQVETEKGPMLGSLKIAVYAHDAHSFLCLHDEPGYAKTFARVVKGLASSLRGGDDARAGARFAEIAVMRMGSFPTGYTERVVWGRKGGGRVAATYSAHLLPRGPADLVAFDSYAEEEMDGKDLLASGSYAHLTNGEADASIRLTRAKDGKTYRYEGEKDGKRLAGTFKTRAGISTEFWAARRLAAPAPLPKGELRHEAYSYEANPVGTMAVVYRRDPAGPRRALMELGPIRVSGELDAHGLFATSEIPIGPTTLVVERTWSRGAP
jgi:hypothetical protein